MHERKSDRADRDRGEAVDREENVGMGRLSENYYSTDMRHRYIWWQSRDDVVSEP